jgi:hypothetical protein
MSCVSSPMFLVNVSNFAKSQLKKLTDVETALPRGRANKNASSTNCNRISEEPTVLITNNSLNVFYYKDCALGVRRCVP